MPKVHVLQAWVLGNQRLDRGAFLFIIKTKKEERGQRHIRSKPPPQRKQPMSREDAGTYASDSFNAPHKAAMCACLNSIEWPLLVIANDYIFCVRLVLISTFKFTSSSIKFKQIARRTSDYSVLVEVRSTCRQRLWHCGEIMEQLESENAALRAQVNALLQAATNRDACTQVSLLQHTTLAKSATTTQR